MTNKELRAQLLIEAAQLLNVKGNDAPKKRKKILTDCYNSAVRYIKLHKLGKIITGNKKEVESFINDDSITRVAIAEGKYVDKAPTNDDEFNEMLKVVNRLTDIIDTVSLHDDSDLKVELTIDDFGKNDSEYKIFLISSLGKRRIK